MGFFLGSFLSASHNEGGVGMHKMDGIFGMGIASRGFGFEFDFSQMRYDFVPQL
jgi:hypothetical protein